MDARFGRALARLHGTASSRLADSLGSYTPRTGPTVNDLALMLDRGAQLEGANETLLASTVAISWAAAQLASVERGGIFVVGAERFIIEDTIANDGHYLTAACMVDR